MQPLLPPANAGSRARVLRAWLVGTFVGRALLAGAAIKLVAFLLALVLGSSRGLDAIGDLALVAATIALGYRLYVDAVEEGCRSGLAEENRITHLPSTAGAHTRFIQTILQALERDTDTNARAQEHDPRRRPPGNSGYG